MHVPELTALRRGAGVCALLVLAARADACLPDRVDDVARVANIYDGDTVRLNDGRTVRVIGIDTPELGHDGREPEPFAQQAAIALEALLARHDHRVALRYDRAERDDYGRWLAHLYAPDQTSIAVHLLRSGLATHLTVPPDLFNLDCYRDAEAQARAKQIGIWGLLKYQIAPSIDIDPDARGFRRVRGNVVRVGHSRSSVWLNLEGDLALRIDRADTHHFPGLDFDRLEGTEVVARGWLYERNGELRMQIRHPAALEHLF